MLTDDLARRVALDALGTRVPGRDATARVEHEDRVVFHALHEHSEFLSGVGEVFGCLPGPHQGSVRFVAQLGWQQTARWCVTARWCSAARQLQRNAGAGLFARGNLDRAAVCAGDLARDEEAQTEPI